MRAQGTSWFYLDHAPCHDGLVVLVLNHKNLHVSLQYHVAFDDNFSTVQYMKNGKILPRWKDLVDHNSESSTDITMDLENIWDVDTSDCEEGPVDPNLVLT